MLARDPIARAARHVVAALALGALFACVGVAYQPAGKPVTPRAGESLLLARIRWVHDGRERFPWRPSLFSTKSDERHIWFLRLDSRAVSAELHPDGDGSLAIWLAHGDYALLGSIDPRPSGLNAYEVAALVRVPADSVVTYAGELTFTTVTREGGHFSRGEFGTPSVTIVPADTARATLERRFKAAPPTPAVSLWCTGDSLPAFSDAKLAVKARALLDAGCRARP